MAQTATLHHFAIQLADMDRAVYETLELRVARQPSETAEFMLTRVLAYCLEYQDGIVLTEGIAAVDEPAVLVRDLTGRVTAWIEVGAPDAERLHRGSKHTDRYAWGRVAGFDDAPDAFFEAISAQLKIGPLQTPRLTMLVLRLDGEEHHLNTPLQALRADCDWRFFEWRFDSRRQGLRIHGRVHAARGDFVGLRYMNPPGGDHTCLNSKIAACELTLEAPGRPPRQLRTANRAAFEILTDETSHGVPVVA